MYADVRNEATDVVLPSLGVLLEKACTDGRNAGVVEEVLGVVPEEVDQELCHAFRVFRVPSLTEDVNIVEEPTTVRGRNGSNGWAYQIFLSPK